MLRRFADARLRAVLRRALNARNKAREEARTARRTLAARDREIGTLRTELAAWQRFAHDNRYPNCPCSERARTQETQP